uniref:Uncharacterized protein n=1 Tax=Romanomermis culicivorax TaxID=13658 RepID=A0A915IA07_ROMCU
MAQVTALTSGSISLGGEAVAGSILGNIRAASDNAPAGRKLRVFTVGDVDDCCLNWEFCGDVIGGQLLDNYIRDGSGRCREKGTGHPLLAMGQNGNGCLSDEKN